MLDEVSALRSRMTGIHLLSEDSDAFVAASN